MIAKIKEHFGYKKKLKELERRYSNCLESYAKPLRDAKQNNQNEFRRLLAERDADCLEYELQLKKHISNHILGKAARIYAQRPDIDDKEMWNQQFRGEYLILSEKGLAEVDSVILKKRKERMQVWVPLISALTGLIAALVGLMALFIRRG